MTNTSTPGRPELIAVSYIRVSTTDQATRGGLSEGLSIPAQRQAIAAKAQSIGAVVIEEFVDAGESGTSAAKRADLQRMLEYLSTNRVDVVLVHKIDRLARNRADDVAINIKIREAGARLVSVAENVDETPSGMLMHGIMSSISEFYSRNLANEVLKGMEQKARNGGTLAKAPLGYLNTRTIVNGVEARTVTFDPERADHIRWAFATYAADPDMTINRLTTLLNDRGLTTRPTRKQPAKPLQRSHVQRILNTRYYLGFVTLRGVEYPGNHEPLIDAETFQAVQDRLRSNRAGGNRERKHLHYLSGALWCARCHSRMIYTVNRGRGGHYEYYVCNGRQNMKNACTMPHIAVSRLEDTVAEIWHEEQAKWQTTALPQLKHGLKEHLRSIQEGADRNSSSLKRSIDKIRRERLTIAEKAIAGSVPDDIARTKQSQLARQLGTLEAELRAIEAVGIDTDATLHQLIGKLADPGHTYSQLSPALRRTYNQAWFNRIYIDARTNDPVDGLDAEADRTLVADALERSRLITLESAKQHKADSKESALCSAVQYGKGSNNEPMVVLAGIEPATFPV